VRFFSGAVFDGTYLYLSPGEQGITARYDTRAPFTDVSSWAAFDLGTLSPQDSFRGGVFDGRYVYFTPRAGSTGSTDIARLDTHAKFTDPSAWSSVNLQSIEPGATGYDAAAFDGRYVYFAPDYSTTLAARYDTDGALADAASWSFFDVTAIDASAGSLLGATFDGRLVYFTGNDGSILRLDTQAVFTSAAAWSSYPLGATSGTTYLGSIFDGRYVNFVPSGARTTGADPVAARLDTLGDFTSASAWATHDTTNPGGPVEQYAGGAFDGRYVYLVPDCTITERSVFSGSTVARFDAKQPPSMPAAYHGSFL
jgi:hypothetical protein